MIALLLAANLAMHAGLPAATPVTTSHQVAADGEQGISRGVRNMLVGGAFVLAGLAVLPAAALVFGVGLGTAIVVRAFMGPAPATPFVTGGLFLAAIVSFVAATLMIGGVLWTGVNGMLVLMRLSPDYKPGPATEYLDM